MIETVQAILVQTGSTAVWDYVRDIRRWAELLPGYQECEVIDDKTSRWTVKVGTGGMVRKVSVLVSIDNWTEPERVDFSFQLEGDPCEGGGAFLAAPQGSDSTDVTLQLQVSGSGPMAPMWEAMSKPLLPQLAKSFGGSLKREIEASAGVAVEPAPPGLLARLWQWLARLFRKPAEQEPEPQNRDPGQEGT